MKTIELTNASPDVASLLDQARSDDIVVRVADGSEFLLVAIDDFDREIARTRANPRIMALLEVRTSRPRRKPRLAATREAPGADGPPPAFRSDTGGDRRGQSLVGGVGELLPPRPPGRVFASLNCFVQNRMRRHLQRRSQRHLRPPEGVSFYAYLQRLGLRRLRATRC